MGELFERRNKMNRYEISHKRYIEKRIGEQCRRVRIAHGYEIKDLADEFEYTPYFVSQFETGNRFSTMLFFKYLNKWGMDVWPEVKI